MPTKVHKKFSKNKKIKFTGLINRKKLLNHYSNSDILIYPGYTDSFGFAFLEAMSFGIPIITVDGDSREETIDEGKTGFIINRPKKFSGWDKFGKEEKRIVSEIIKKTSILIENKKLREKMSKNCLEEIKSGKFSIKERNKKLKEIYNEAIKD